MHQYVIQRLLSTVPVMLGIVTIVFILVRILPGDPTSVLAAQSAGSAEDVARLRAEYGLDRPLGIQYIDFLFNLAQGDLGTSFFTHQPISQIIVQQAPATIALASAAMAVATGIGLLLGVLAAIQKGTWVDILCMGLSVAGVSMPITLSGLIMILIFSLALRWLPATGQGSLEHLAMPAAVMGLASAGSIARLVRTQLLETLNQEYIYVARAKGLSEYTILVRHALRNALGSILTLIGLQFGFMLGGAVVTESVFARQGLGRTLVDAILYHDYPVVEGIVIISAFLYTGLNLAIDVIYCSLDPRVCQE